MSGIDYKRGAILALLGLSLPSAGLAQTMPNGQMLYNQRCRGCHEQGVGGAPVRAAISQKSHAAIVGTLTTGVMKPQASGLKPEEIAALATYLAIRKPALAPAAAPSKASKTVVTKNR